MREITKHDPPPNGVRCGSWQQAAAMLRVELEQRPERSERTERARNHFKDQVTGEHRRSSVEALSKEQHALCAFCERRVDPREGSDKKRAFVRVAHWVPVMHDPLKAVTWNNLFASCSDPGTCDVHQESGAPGFETPAERDWTHELEFTDSGEMHARANAPAAFSVAFPAPSRPGLWNLNVQRLTAARLAAVTAERKVVLQQSGRGSKAAVLRKRIAEHLAHPQEFQSVVLFMLQRWLDRSSSHSSSP